MLVYLNFHTKREEMTYLNQIRFPQKRKPHMEVTFNLGIYLNMNKNMPSVQCVRKDDANYADSYDDSNRGDKTSVILTR